ncbi:MAG: hypothetical protein Q9168_000294 [Polycauliona sp. 1 TL-2023]
MPAPKGGTPRKGRLAKKAQLDKMVEASQKSPSKLQKSPPSKANTSKHNPQTSANQNTTLESVGKESTRLVVGKLPTNLTDLDQLPKPAEIQAETVPQLEEHEDRTVTIRLSCQPPKCFPTKRTIPHRRIIPQLTLPKPTPIKNPNRVVLRLPSTRKPNETSFLSLPRELRNQIYDYAMPCNKYRLEWIPRTDQRPTELTYTLPLQDFKGPKLTDKAVGLRRDFDLPKRAFIEKTMPRYRLSPGPAALLLVSRQVNIDATPMFYGRNTFSFAAMNPLGKFLDNLRPETRSMLRSLELLHSTASNPELRDNQRWKNKHDHRWQSLCFQIRNQCDRLEDLTLDLYIKDLPFKLGPLAGWMSPLYAFMGLTNLRHIDFRLHQVEAEEAVLMVEAYTVRKELMGNNFYEPTNNTNKPILQKPVPRRACPGVNALRVTVGDRRVPASCIKPSLGPGATVFWSPPPIESEHGKKKGTTNDDHKGKVNEVIKPPLTWTPPATLIGTAIPLGETKPGVVTTGSKGKGKASGTKADAKPVGGDGGKRTLPNQGHFRKVRKAVE